VVRLRYDDGTIRVDGEDADALDGLSFVERDGRSESRRAPAFRYPFVRDTCYNRNIPVEDAVLDTPALPSLSTAYELRPYQQEALDAWRGANDRGVVELPTGSGKTVLAIAAIAALETPTLVVVPTIDLLEQWRGELEAEFGDAVAIGQLVCTQGGRVVGRAGVGFDQRGAAADLADGDRVAEYGVKGKAARGGEDEVWEEDGGW
jgi:hypothetical protein